MNPTNVGLTIAARVKKEFVIPANKAANCGAISSTRTLRTYKIKLLKLMADFYFALSPRSPTYKGLFFLPGTGSKESPATIRAYRKKGRTVPKEWKQCALDRISGIQ